MVAENLGVEGSFVTVTLCFMMALLVFSVVYAAYFIVSYVGFVRNLVRLKAPGGLWCVTIKCREF